MRALRAVFGDVVILAVKVVLQDLTAFLQADVAGRFFRELPKLLRPVPQQDRPGSIRPAPVKLLVTAFLVGHGEVEIGPVIFLCRSVPAFIDCVLHQVFRPVVIGMQFILEIHFADAVPVRHVVDFVIGHPLCDPVMAARYLHNPGFVLVGDIIDAGAVIAVFFYQGADDLHGFPGASGPFRRQPADPVAQAAAQAFIIVFAARNGPVRTDQHPVFVIEQVRERLPARGPDF